jgi:hypothetical protein
MDTFVCESMVWCATIEKNLHTIMCELDLEGYWILFHMVLWHGGFGLPIWGLPVDEQNPQPKTMSFRHCRAHTNC